MPAIVDGILLWRIRLSIGLISLAIVILELALMRAFAIRFWQHFAHMVISIAMLGYGASGTILALIQNRVQTHREFWMSRLALAFAVAVPLSLTGLATVPLNPLFLAWDLSQGWNVLLFEILTLVPFLLGAGLIGLGVMTTPAQVGGHYAASFAGSGLGAIAGILLLFRLSPDEMALATAWIGLLSGCLLLPAWNSRSATAVVTVAGILVFAGTQWPAAQLISEYKALSLLGHLPKVTRLSGARGPLGQLDVITGEGIHFAPGLSIQCPATIPSQAVLLTDGDQPEMPFSRNTLSRLPRQRTTGHFSIMSCG